MVKNERNYPGADILKGINLTVSEWVRPSPKSAPTDSKAAGLYMICSLSKHKAEQAGFDDALMLDYRGYIAEATGANIFFVKDKEIFTPKPDCFLNGITRQTVIEIAKENKIKVNEDHFKFDVARWPNRHIGFEFWPHICLGAALARLELKVGLTALFERIATFETDGPLQWVPNNRLLGLKRLPLRIIFKGLMDE